MLNLISKYKLILLPLLIVVIFDLSILAMNYVISAQLATSAVNINIAGRQRMLSQKMSKAVLLIHYQYESAQDSQLYEQELRDAVTVFDQTLTAFISGGSTQSATGKQIMVKKLTNEDIQATLSQAKLLWNPLEKKLNNINNNDVVLHSTIEAISTENLKLLALMNQLTNQLVSQAKNKTYLLRSMQTVIVIMILLSFVLALLRLARKETYFKNIMEKSSDIIVGIDVRTGTITFISASVHLLLEHDDAYYMGHPINRLFDQKSALKLSTMLSELSESKTLSHDRCDVELLTKGTDTVFAEMLMQLSISENGDSLELNADIRDISERKKTEQKLVDLAYKDILTGLPNRMMFSVMADHLIASSRRKNKHFSLMFIDLDGFKLINDLYGHAVGDKLLIEVANRIQRCLRDSDTVSRLGGDEFVVLLENTTDKKDLHIIGKKIITTLSAKMLIDSHECQIGASIGIALYPQNGSDIPSLLKSADGAMYKVKAAGKNAISFVD